MLFQLRVIILSYNYILNSNTITKAYPTFLRCSINALYYGWPIGIIVFVNALRNFIINL